MKVSICKHEPRFTSHSYCIITLRSVSTEESQQDYTDVIFISTSVAIWVCAFGSMGELFLGISGLRDGGGGQYAVLFRGYLRDSIGHGGWVHLNFLMVHNLLNFT